LQRVAGAPDEVAVEFSLDGVRAEDADRLLRAIATLPDVKAVVADRSGISQDEDWDRVVLGERRSTFPNLLTRPGV
jgi:hypothetical protein